MLHLTGRTDLIRTIMAGVTSRSCLRAFSTGEVEVLGGFDPISPNTDLPGFVIRVTSVHGSEWGYVLVPDGITYSVYSAGRVYWENWIGDPNGPRLTIANGDHPKKYGELRDEATAETGT